MKNFLLSSLFLFLFGFLIKANAQTNACNVSDLLIQNVRITDTNPNDGKCMGTFNVAFTTSGSNGGKFVFLQTYIQSVSRNGAPLNNPNPYRNYFNCQNGSTNEKKPPVRGDVGTPLLNIAIDISGTTPVFTDYKPDNSLATTGVTSTSTVSTLTLPNGDIRYVLTGLEIVLPYECNSNTQYTFVTDIFSTNAANATTLNCVTCGIATPLGYITIGGATNCNVVNATFTNNTNSAIQLTYSLYADANSNGVLTTTQYGGFDPLITSNTITVAANATVTTNVPLAGSNLDKDVFVLLNIGGAQRAQLLPTACAIAPPPLPITLQSFSAKRNKDRVALNWETASESNNKGFRVQRNMGQGWTDITFVGTKANAGNSNAVLAYAHSDINTEKGITQYRLMQVDFDGKSKVSDVRTVRGEAQANKTMVYPNPSSDGSINLLFEETKGNRDVFVSDMNGRVIKQYRNVSVTNMRVDNLTPGVYTLRIVDQANGAQSNEKIVVNR